VRLYVDGEPFEFEGRVNVTATNPTDTYRGDSIRPLDLKEIGGAITAEFEDPDAYQRLLGRAEHSAELTIERQTIRARRA
jgi:hypothetical protein